jgi:hypothetical protein
MALTRGTLVYHHKEENGMVRKNGTFQESTVDFRTKNKISSTLCT